MDLNQLRERFAAHDVRRVKVGGFDVDGVLRGKYVSLEKFWSVAEKGFGFCDVIFGWDIADVCYDNAQVTGRDSGYPDILRHDRPGQLPRAAVRAATRPPSCSTSAAATARPTRPARAPCSSA